MRARRETSAARTRPADSHPARGRRVLRHIDGGRRTARVHRRAGGLQPLAEDVREHAIAAARDDYRFPPVQTSELGAINVEVSRLTAPVPLEYSTPEDLIAKLRPHVDGVILRDGSRRATFLPQVWEKLPRAEDFLANLCYKMGASADLWKRKHLDVKIYQVEEFRE